MGKYLDFYKTWAERERLPSNGLCHCFRDDRTLALFRPSPSSDGYWGYDGETVLNGCMPWEKHFYYGSPFTPLRQNIVLFMAAIHGENFNELKK